MIVLGEIGRNFAAGMSGGIAYILERNIGNINKEMVDIDPLNEDDYITIKNSLKKHLNFTKSGLADKMLQNWATAKADFIKVIPGEYKEVLRKKALVQINSLV